jgi:hypothetical protein
MTTTPTPSSNGPTPSTPAAKPSTVEAKPQTSKPSKSTSPGVVIEKRQADKAAAELRYVEQTLAELRGLIGTVDLERQRELCADAERATKAVKRALASR